MKIEKENKMEKRYLIRMNNSEDWLRHWDEGTQVVNDFLLPIGPYEKDEMSDTITIRMRKCLTISIKKDLRHL